MRTMPAGVVIALLLGTPAPAVDPLLAVRDDPLVRLPGTQPAPEGTVTLEAPDRCLNCHAGYDATAEPGQWKGSMMAQAARDPLYFACVTVAAQDSQWALGRPNATDLCLRCHFPAGWVQGRSDPPNASAMTGADWDGVTCDTCHRAVDPFFEATFEGSREGSDWTGIWDESGASSTPSAPAALATRDADRTEAAAIHLFANGAKDQPFYVANRPPATWTENGAGEYFLAANNDKRGPFADAEPRHTFAYSRYHRSRHFCQTCHDVSNPALANLGADPAAGPLPSEVLPPSAFFHVERTASEFLLSDFGQPGGAPGSGPFDPAVFDTPNPGEAIARCQDCHMPNVRGRGCDKAGVPLRPDESVEHAKSAVPRHDLTGGNVWISEILASTVVGSPNHDAVNAALLGQGASVLTLDLTQGLGIDAPALLAGAARARAQLAKTAALESLAYDPGTGQVSFRVRNHTGHKLPSGFPEGRRVFLNVRAFAGGSLVHEVNPYDGAASTLKGLGGSYLDPDGALPAPAPLAAGEVYDADLVYEMHPSSLGLTGETETFHFVLATDRYKDNRIPPQGFRIAEAAARLSQPRAEGADAPGLYTAAEYAGGHDDVGLTIAPGAERVEVALYYQTTSREYVEFLRDEIRGDPGRRTLPDAAYVAQTDPFFAGLRAWGDTLWDLWVHNRARDGAAPVLLASAALDVPAVSAGDVIAGEGAGSLVFTVALTLASPHTLTVDYATVNQGAQAGADYTARAGTLQFAPGVTAKDVTILVTPDLLDEDDETFALDLRSAVGARIADARAVATIQDDDPLPLLSIADGAVTEGDTAKVTASFTVTLSAPSGRSVAVGWSSAVDAGAPFPAQAGVDFSRQSGTLTFTPGATRRVVRPSVKPDLQDEEDETFLAALTAPVSALLADAIGRGTIVDNDPPPALALSDVSVMEGDTANVWALFTVTLSSPSGKTIQADFATARDVTGAHPATTADYLARAGTFSLAPGTTGRTLGVTVKADLADEPDETFLLRLASPQGATLADAEGVGTILDEDP